MKLDNLQWAGLAKREERRKYRVLYFGSTRSMGRYVTLWLREKESEESAVSYPNTHTGEVKSTAFVQQKDRLDGQSNRRSLEHFSQKVWRKKTHSPFETATHSVREHAAWVALLAVYEKLAERQKEKVYHATENTHPIILRNRTYAINVLREKVSFLSSDKHTVCKLKNCLPLSRLQTQTLWSTCLEWANLHWYIFMFVWVCVCVLLIIDLQVYSMSRRQLDLLSEAASSSPIHQQWNISSGSIATADGDLFVLSFIASEEKKERSETKQRDK